MGSRKKTVLGFLELITILFLIFEKGIWKKLCQVFWDSYVSFFEYFKRGKVKNCARYFEIRKYAFLIIEMGRTKKAVPAIFRFISMLFVNIQKRVSAKKTPPGFLEFISMIFLIFEKVINKKMC